MLVGPENAIELTLDFNQDDLFPMDETLAIVGAKMKHLEKLQIFLSKLYIGEWTYSLPLLFGIRFGNFHSLTELRFVFTDRYGYVGNLEAFPIPTYVYIKNKKN